jgi:hypothetical protein
MTNRIRIADIVEAALQGDYFLNADTMRAFILVANTAQAFVAERAAGNPLADLREDHLKVALALFDFSEAA